MILRELALLNQLERCHPLLPGQLDTHLQQDLNERNTVTNPRFVERVIKITALFSEHLVLRDSNVLDHLGFRELLLNLNDTQFREFRKFACDPGKNPTGLGPIILASTPRSLDEPREPFPLVELLQMQFGAHTDSRYRHYKPWEVSSVARLELLDEINQRIRNAPPDQRLRLAIEEAYGLTLSRFEDYLSRVSQIWDECADTTRVPRPTESTLVFEQKLLKRFGDIQRLGPNAEGAGRFLDEVGKGNITLIRGEMNRWFRENSLPDFQWTMGEIYNTAFLSAFPGERAAVSSHNPRGIGGMWVGPDANSDPRRKRGQAEALAEAVARTIRQTKHNVGYAIKLDSVSYQDIQALRQQKEFHDNLKEISREWLFCTNQDELGKALARHARMIAKKLPPSKVVEVNGAAVIISAAAGAATGAFTAIRMNPQANLLTILEDALVGATIVSLAKFVQTQVKRRSVRGDMPNLAKEINTAAADTSKALIA